jgi:protoheme IX farnesyltransferase
MGRSYASLIKPGIIGGNLVTAIAGFALGAPTPFPWLTALVSLSGLACVIGSGCTFNNYFDRHADAKMARTRHRPLAARTLSCSAALLYGTALGLLGLALLLTTSFLAALLAFTGFVSYVLIYGYAKYKTPYATLIGSIPGAIPPIVGYAAAAQHLDCAALLLFLIVFFWQMPHFYAIALLRKSDYKAAAIPVWPLAKGIPSTLRHMALFTALFAGTSTLPFFYGYTGPLYLATALAVSGYWLLPTLQGLRSATPLAAVRRSFHASLLTIFLLSLAIVIDRAPMSNIPAKEVYCF